MCRYTNDVLDPTRNNRPVANIYGLTALTDPFPMTVPDFKHGC